MRSSRSRPARRPLPRRTAAGSCRCRRRFSVTRAVRLGVVAAALAGVGSVALALAHVATPGDFPNDLLPDYVSARALIEGQDPYAPTFELILEHAPVEGDTY